MKRRSKRRQPQSASAEADEASGAATADAALLAQQQQQQPQQQPSSSSRRLLLVIAHPDDETMFFTPAIAHFQRWWRRELFILCCSTGDYYGQGGVRREELRAAARLLGIPPERVELIDHPELQDGPDNAWPIPLLARLIREAMDRHGIDEVLTFDDGGVSGHPNHTALSHALAHLLADASNTASSSRRKAGQLRKTSRPLTVWRLETTGLLRKYLGVLDVPLSLLLMGRAPQERSSTTHPEQHGGNTSMAVLNPSPWATYQAMLAHASQFVWYRRLFILFSRYTYVNTLVAEASSSS